MAIVIQMKYPNSDEYRKVFTFDFDYCNFFGIKEQPRNIIETHAMNMLEIWTSDIKKYGQMPTCPVHVVGLKNFLSNFTLLRQFLTKFYLIFRVTIA